jgi:aminoglycoside phosphotransferase (APT) family kinase protein
MLEPRKYSERLGVIDPGQLFDVAELFDLGDVRDAYPLGGGLFGQNLGIETTRGRFVLRGNPSELHQLSKERYVAGFINANSSLPAPWPYEISEDTTIFGWPFAIMPFMPGTMGEELLLTSDDRGRVELADAVGEALAALHEAESEFPGPYDAQKNAFIEVDDFKDWTLHRLSHLRNLCRAVNALSTEAELFIDELIESNAAALDEPFTPVLVHHDFKYGNLNFDPDTYGSTGVFDLNEAYLGDGEEDLVRMMWLVKDPDERRAFVRAYVENWPLRPGAAERLMLYMLADRMVIWEYGRRVAGWFGDTTFLADVRPFLDLARAVGSSA